MSAASPGRAIDWAGLPDRHAPVLGASGPLLPFRPFARERLVLVLIALSGLTIVQFKRHSGSNEAIAGAGDSGAHGDVTIERYGTPLDRARKGHHLYTDKAPGLSLLAVPAVVVVRVGERITRQPRARLIWESAPRLFIVRLLTVGSFLVLLSWLIGRTAEGLVPRSGATAAVTASIGNNDGRAFVGPRRTWSRRASGLGRSYSSRADAAIRVTWRQEL